MPDAASFTLRPLKSPDNRRGTVQQLWATRFGGDPSTQKNWIEAALPDLTIG